MVSLRTVFGEEADVLLERQFQLLLSTAPLLAMGVALLSPILETLTGPFGVTSIATGQLVSAFLAPGIVVVPLAGLLADRYGRKPLIVGGLLLFGLAGTAIAFTTDFQVALGLRFLQGLGASALGPVVITALGDLYTGSREATAQGLRFTSVGVSQAVVPPIAGALVVVAWQLPFLLYALAIPAALGLWWRFEEPTAIGVGADGASPADLDPGDQLRALAKLGMRPRVFTVVLARQVPTFTWYTVLTFNSILVVQVLGSTPGVAGALITLSSAAKAGAATQVGRATADFRRRVRLLVVVHLLLGGGLVIAGLAPSVAVVGIGFVAIGAGLGVAMALYRSVITGFAPEHLRGGIVSFSETWGRLSATSAPVLLGAAVVFLEPTFGSALALRWSLAVTGTVGAVVGIGALVVALNAPAVGPRAAKG